MSDNLDLNKYIGTKIKYYRTKNNLTAEELAKKIGVSRATITRYESGTRGTTQNSLFKLSDALNVSINDFFPQIEKENKLPSNIHPISNRIVNIPIIGTIAMGSPITAEQNIIGHTSEEFDDLPNDELFALECKGHSMEPTIPDGAIAIFTATSQVEDGEIAAVLVDHDEEATLKRVQHLNGQTLLKPDNPDYPSIVLSKDNPGRIIGKLYEYKVKAHK